MPVVEERLSLLEGRMEQVGTTLVRMEGILSSLVQKVDLLNERVDRLDRRVDQLDQRIDQLDQRIGQLDQRVGQLEQRVDRLEQRVDKLDERFLKLFLWVIGIQITTLIALVAGLFGVVATLI